MGGQRKVRLFGLLIARQSPNLKSHRLARDWGFIQCQLEVASEIRTAQLKFAGPEGLQRDDFDESVGHFDK